MLPIYPRTSSRHLSENAADQLADRLAAMQKDKKYAHLFPEKIKSLKGNKRYVDDAKATEHHAIVPTGEIPTDVTADEEKLYELILRYILHNFSPTFFNDNNRLGEEGLRCNLSNEMYFFIDSRMMMGGLRHMKRNGQNL